MCRHDRAEAYAREAADLMARMVLHSPGHPMRQGEDRRVARLYREGAEWWPDWAHTKRKAAERQVVVFTGAAEMFRAEIDRLRGEGSD